MSANLARLFNINRLNIYRRTMLVALYR